MKRLLLVPHAPTGATRTAAFPADEPLDGRGRDAAAGLAAALPRRCDVRCGPALRCRQTAQAAGLAAVVDAGLADQDHGNWAGLTLDAVAGRDPEAARAWREDPEAAPHGGESLRAVAVRVAAWMDAQDDGTVAAITHAGVVRAAVVHALGAPLPAFWQIDAAPLSVTELHGRGGSWTVARVNHPVAA